MTDSWPQRNGVPVLESAVAQLEFVRDCLSLEEPRQAEAHRKVEEALLLVRQAIHKLKK